MLDQSTSENQIPQNKTAPAQGGPDDRLIALTELAKNKRIPVDVLIFFASQGNLEVVFEVPRPHPRLVLLPDRQENVVGEVDAFLHTPDYLYLLPDDCKQFLSHQEVLVSTSPYGYRTRQRRQCTTRLEASEVGDAARSPITVTVDGNEFVTPKTRFSFWKKWAFFLEQTPATYKFSIEKLYVRDREFSRWKSGDAFKEWREQGYKNAGWNAKPAADVSDFVGTEGPKDGDFFASEALLRMGEIARLAWGNSRVIPGEGDYPEDEWIAYWLMDTAPEHFPEAKARLAASLLRPTFAKDTKGDRKRPSPKPNLTPEKLLEIKKARHNFGAWAGLVKRD